MESERIALITGAAGVMGFATARRLHDDGCQVVLVDIDRAQLEDKAARLGDGAFVRVMNVSSPTEVSEVMAAIASEIGEIDILVNNAGILSKNKALQTTPAEWHEVLKVNLDGAFYLAQAVIPSMRRKRFGRIINTCSLASKTGGITAGTAYSVSKGALVALTCTLAAETAAFGITVNGIAPAYVRTPMITEQLSDEERAMLLDKIPVHRFCEPEEFAHVVSFLAHPLAGFITGEIIDQNGGLHFD